MPCNNDIQNKVKTLKESLGLKDKKVILYCGRLIKQKGFEYLAKAFEFLVHVNPNVFLIVVGGVYGGGEGYSYSELKRLCTLFEDRVLFTGWIETKEKTAYYLLVDVVVVPSVFYAEGAEVWGFAVNESLSVGKPVVATKAVGSAYDLIQNGCNGYIVADKDAEALFKAIKSILDNDCIIKDMSAQSLKIQSNGFTYENMLQGFNDAISFSTILKNP